MFTEYRNKYIRCTQNKLLQTTTVKYMVGGRTLADGGAAARSAEGLWLARRGCCTVVGKTLNGMAGLLHGRRKDSGSHNEAAAHSAEGPEQP
jgi:hypothetical protein